MARKRTQLKREVFIKSMMLAVGWITFALYFVLVFYIVFLARRRHNLDPDFIRHFLNITPGKEKIDFFTSTIQHTDVEEYNFYTNLFGNMLLFVPLPFFLARIFGIGRLPRLLLISICCSLFIEVAQYVFAIGVSDIDDVILNSIGALVGLTAALPYTNHFSKINKH